jgi:hypothetical protein
LPHPLDEAFPFPNGYETDLKKKLRAESIKDYVAIFEKRRGERLDGKLADADVQEIMRLAEDLDYVDVTEIDYISSESIPSTSDPRIREGSRRLQAPTRN